VRAVVKALLALCWGPMISSALLFRVRRYFLSLALRGLGGRASAVFHGFGIAWRGRLP